MGTAKNLTLREKSGREKFIGMEHSLSEYWSWAHSDIMSNSERGKLAEYIVRCALQIHSPFRIEWDAVDLVSSEGIKVEVKSSAYLQTWKQNRLSAIRFDIAPKNAWNSEENFYSCVSCRSADIYVFCLFASKDAETANPLDLSQWEFYILSTQVLNHRVPLQKSIGLNSLLRLGARKVGFNELYSAVRAVARLC